MRHLLTSASTAAAFGGVLGALEGLVFAAATQAPEDPLGRLLLVPLWAGVCWAIATAIAAAIASAGIAMVRRADGDPDPPARDAAASALGGAIAIYLFLGFAMNRELLGRLTSPPSLAANGVWLAACIGGGWLAYRRMSSASRHARLADGTSGRAVYLAGLIAAALVLTGVDGSETDKLSLRGYAKARVTATAAGVAEDGPPEATLAVGGQPNVLFILVDAMRPDRLGCYGHERDTSPNIDELARQGLLFERVYCTKTSTSPSMASVFTGTYPHTHGIYRWAQWLDDSFVTLAEAMVAEGYRSVSVTSNSNVGETFNLHQGFDRVVEVFESDPAVTEAALTELDELAAGDEPWLLYVHYMATHEPFRPAEDLDGMYVGDGGVEAELSDRVPVVESKSARGHIRTHSAIGTGEQRTDPSFYVAQYDACVRTADREIGRLMEALRDGELLSNTLIVVTADHGESFGEHGWWFQHGATVYEEEARVPLVLVHPDIAPGRVAGLVSHVQLMPTLLQALGLPVPSTVESRPIDIDTRPCTNGRERAAFIEGRTQPPLIRAVVRGECKLIWNWPPLSMHRVWGPRAFLNPRSRPKVWRRALAQLVTPTWELHDLAADPDEHTNALTDDPKLTAELKALLFRHLASAPRDERNWAAASLKGVDEETRQRLKSLGYVD